MTMQRTTVVLALALAATAVAAAAFAHGSAQSMRRHQIFMMHGAPQPYAGQTSPLPQTADTVAKGRKLYDDNCALCHGADGGGHGPGAKDLDVPPADLRPMMAMPMMRDDFFLWAISDGGQPFGSPMPAFKDALKRDDIWRVIAFMRAGFPR